VRAREVLARGREELEAQVGARTAELQQALERLQAEMAQREQAEANLRQVQKMEAVGQLTGGIAHDFNNMLQGIGGSLDVARRRAAEGRIADVLRYLDPARQAVDRAAGLTRRLLAFARRQRLEPQPVDPDALVAGMADLVRRTVGPAIRLELLLRDGQARVLCDPGELESALLNLCINARDAMPEGGRLTISTEDVRLSAADLVGQQGAAPGDYVEISVADTGKGMPSDVAERAFEPFFTTKPLGHGTGLGLSQVYGFVRQSGGVVRLESAPGSGTTVRVCLPQHAGADMVEGPGAAPAPNEAGPGQAVLLVDDEDIARQAAAERLRELGYRVLEAADGPAALHLLDGGARVDMLVTDVGLPNGMNGRQVAEAVCERRPGIPLLFITGYAGTELPPGSEVIDKPFDLDTLARRVQAALAVA
jgi:signal transduction histidine kinase